MGNVEGQGPEHSGGVSRSDFDQMVALQDQRYEENEQRYLKDRSESREQRRLQYEREEEQRRIQLAREEEQDRLFLEIREKSRIAEATIKNACIQRISENSRMLKNELDQVSERLESKMEDIENTLTAGKVEIVSQVQELLRERFEVPVTEPRALTRPQEDRYEVPGPEDHEVLRGQRETENVTVRDKATRQTSYEPQKEQSPQRPSFRDLQYEENMR